MKDFIYICQTQIFPDKVKISHDKDYDFTIKSKALLNEYLYQFLQTEHCIIGGNKKKSPNKRIFRLKCSGLLRSSIKYSHQIFHCRCLCLLQNDRHFKNINNYDSLLFYRLFLSQRQW